jgi:hypothetical protein
MRILFLALPLALLVLAGCSGSSDVTTDHYAPDIVAVTAPDSLAAGQQLQIKVHWRSSLTCQSFENVSVQPIDDSTFFVQTSAKEVHDPKSPCAARDTILEGLVQMAGPPARHFRVLVYGAHQQDTVAVLGGATPAAIERHGLEIDDAVTNGPVQGGSGDYVDLGSQVVFASLVTDTLGMADTSFACPGAARGYKILVVGASGRRATLVFQSYPEHCGIPEKTWVRL